MTRFKAFRLAWRDASALEEALDTATKAVAAAQEIRGQRDHLVAVNLRQKQRIVILTEESARLRVEVAEHVMLVRAVVEAFEYREA